MTFKKGQSGNPQGRRVEQTPWAEALRICANEVDATGIRRLRRLAIKAFDMAIYDGNIEAMKEIGVRLDGKPVQPLSGADGEGAVLIRVITGVPRDEDA